jgi:uncharacterized protein
MVSARPDIMDCRMACGIEPTAETAPPALTGRVVGSIADVPAADWDALTGGDNPTVSHAFLRILEESGSAIGESGWSPQHLLLQDPAGRLMAAAPLYLKSHSYGEYVFDHAWAQAWEQAGGRYYPKLQLAVPFTPVPGPRLLLHPQAPASALPTMIRLLERLTAGNDLSSLHVTFPPESEWAQLGAAGWLQRTGTQFHWENQGYRSFDDFLARFNSRRRKAVRKERREVADSGVELVTLTGSDLQAEHWDAFFRCYSATSDRKWGWAYLTQDFFHRLGATMPESVVLILARDRGEWVAGALNLLGRDTLYGRNWGCIGDYRFLHFEACYYRAIEFAIAHGLKRVEAGAQGQHKIQRGYLPVPTYSAHFIPNPGFRRAIAGFLEREREAVATEMALLAADSPFRCEE